jgi:hypothetical protein
VTKRDNPLKNRYGKKNLAKSLWQVETLKWEMLPPKTMNSQGKKRMKKKFTLVPPHIEE